MLDKTNSESLKRLDEVLEKRRELGKKKGTGKIYNILEKGQILNKEIKCFKSEDTIIIDDLDTEELRKSLFRLRGVTGNAMMIALGNKEASWYFGDSRHYYEVKDIMEEKGLGL